MVANKLADAFLFPLSNNSNGVGGLQLVLIFDENSRVAAPVDRISGIFAVDLDQANHFGRKVVLNSQGLLERLHFLKRASLLRVVHQHHHQRKGICPLCVESKHFFQLYLRVFLHLLVFTLYVCPWLYLYHENQAQRLLQSTHPEVAFLKAEAVEKGPSCFLEPEEIEAFQVGFDLGLGAEVLLFNLLGQF